MTAKTGLASLSGLSFPALLLDCDLDAWGKLPSGNWACLAIRAPGNHPGASLEDLIRLHGPVTFYVPATEEQIDVPGE